MRVVMDFLPKEGEPTDEQLLMQLVHGLCGKILNEKEEYIDGFYIDMGIPDKQVRRLAKLLVTKLSLPMTTDEVDKSIQWHRENNFPWS
jgi:hypothetical protein